MVKSLHDSFLKKVAGGKKYWIPACGHDKNVVMPLKNGIQKLLKILDSGSEAGMTKKRDCHPDYIKGRQWPRAASQ